MEARCGRARGWLAASCTLRQRPKGRRFVLCCLRAAHPKFACRRRAMRQVPIEQGNSAPINGKESKKPNNSPRNREGWRRARPRSRATRTFGKLLRHRVLEGEEAEEDSGREEKKPKAQRTERGDGLSSSGSFDRRNQRKRRFHKEQTSHAAIRSSDPEKSGRNEFGLRRSCSEASALGIGVGP
jgi:hypothetical protein